MTYFLGIVAVLAVAALALALAATLRVVSMLDAVAGIVNEAEGRVIGRVVELERQMRSRVAELAYLYDVLKPETTDPRSAMAAQIVRESLERGVAESNTPQTRAQLNLVPEREP